MPVFHCLPIPSEVGERGRRTVIDGGGNRLRRVADATRPAAPDGRRLDGSGSPCRHCLDDAQGGDELLLGFYRLPRPRGIYWMPSPIFVHAGPCEAFARIDGFAPIVRNWLVPVRANDREDPCLYDLGHAGDGNEIDDALKRALDDLRTALVGIHTAKPGRMPCQVEPVERA
jgi:hypothetical protein